MELLLLYIQFIYKYRDYKKLKENGKNNMCPYLINNVLLIEKKPLENIKNSHAIKIPLRIVCVRPIVVNKLPKQS